MRHGGRWCVTSASSSSLHAAASSARSPAAGGRADGSAAVRAAARDSFGQSVDAAATSGRTGPGKPGIASWRSPWSREPSSRQMQLLRQPWHSACSRRRADARRRRAHCPSRPTKATPCPHRCRRKAPPTRRPRSAGHAHPEQQELFVVVAARLADGALRRAGLRRGDGLARRRRCAQGTAAAGAVDPRAVPDARRREGLEHAGDRPVPERDQARRRADARRPHRARALPLDQRRDEFGLRQPARVAADEPEGAPSPATRSGPARSPTSTASSRSGPSAWRPTAARSSSASSAAWPTRCTRRS